MARSKRDDERSDFPGDRVKRPDRPRIRTDVRAGQIVLTDGNGNRPVSET